MPASKWVFRPAAFLGGLWLPGAFGGTGTDVQPPGKAAGRWRCPPGGRVWAAPPGPRVWRADPMATFAGYLEKTPGARLWLVFDFGDLPEVKAGATISSATVTAAAGLTAGSAQAVGDYQVGAWYSGGTDGQDYDVLCRAVLSDTTVEEKTGTLKVRTKSE